MPMTETAQRNHDDLFGVGVSTRAVTDPEFIVYFDNFAFDDVMSHGSLDPRLTLLTRLAALIACQSPTEYRVMVGAALNHGISPVEAKEVVYQAVPYLGVARVLDYLTITNEVLAARGVELPLPGQSTTTPESRFENGLVAQSTIIGAELVQSLHANGPADEKHIQNWLTANCFGDNYTRGGLDLATRELLTFVLLVGQGGCDPQVRSHVTGNLNVGNGRGILIDVLSQLLPYIGYPRTLNGLRAVDDVVPAAEGGG